MVWVEYKGAISFIKQASFFYVMLPLRIGLEHPVRPSTWVYAGWPPTKTSTENGTPTGS